MRGICTLLLAAVPAFAADICASKDFEGAYGFLLAGQTGISGRTQPIASVGRIVLDGSGNLSGSSSVNFNGYFLGNPVTGKYEIGSDCEVTWSLQDDSGAFQHFAGRAKPDGSAVDFHQSDPNTEGVTGKLEKVSSDCSAAAFHGRFRWTLSGVMTPFAGNGAQAIGVSGTADVDGAGNVALTENGRQIAGTYQIDEDCFVDLAYEDKKLRGVLIREGKAVMVIETDPKATGAGRFTAE